MCVHLQTRTLFTCMVRYGLLILSRDKQFKDVTFVDCHLKTDAKEDTRACNVFFVWKSVVRIFKFHVESLRKKSFVWNEVVRTTKFQTKYVLVQISVGKFACGQAETRRKKSRKILWAVLRRWYVTVSTAE